MPKSQKYLRAADLAETTGLSSRVFMKMAHSGKISWALQPGGPGHPIMFEKEGFEGWLEAGRLAREVPQPTRPATRRRARHYPGEETSLEDRLRAKLAEVNAIIRAQRNRE